jgi:hypothetical protein
VDPAFISFSFSNIIEASHTATALLGFRCSCVSSEPFIVLDLSHLVSPGQLGRVFCLDSGVSVEHN